MPTKPKVKRPPRPDEDIAKEIIRKFKVDPEVPADRISVNVTQGFVIIEGTVSWPVGASGGAKLRCEGKRRARAGKPAAFGTELVGCVTVEILSFERFRAATFAVVGWNRAA